jgi:UDP-N-acetylglucosamine diphosphorylase/glucosamine-1-phosphate N-acetyltransferase
MPLYLYDDARARRFEPFALTRPIGELRAGAELLRRRWERVAGERASGHLTSAHLARFEELDAPPIASSMLPAGALVVNARCAVALDATAREASHLVCDGRVAAVRLAVETRAAAFADGSLRLESLLAAPGGTRTVAGRWLDEVWDFIGTLQPQLAEDIAVLAPTLDTATPEAALIGGGHVYVERGATVEPLVVFDTTLGAVLVRRGATVHSFTRVVGPCYVGEDSTVAGDRVSGCSIGDTCRVHGEISASIVLGHANKGHDGFVGHSYLGRWVNLGAGTTTSNLKNTYGTVALWTPEGVRDSGLQFLGTMFGDHAKTGIGLRLTTGCVLGAGANVYDAMPPKYVPPFSWGGAAPYAAYDAEKFATVAERAMSRRKVSLGDGARATLAAAYVRGRAGA